MTRGLVRLTQVTVDMSGPGIHTMIIPLSYVVTMGREAMMLEREAMMKGRGVTMIGLTKGMAGIMTVVGMDQEAAITTIPTPSQEMIEVDAGDMAITNEVAIMVGVIQEVQIIEVNRGMADDHRDLLL